MATLATDWLFRPLTETAAALAKRELSPVELMQATLDRIEAVNEKLVAFVALRDADQLLHEAREAERRTARGEAHPPPPPPCPPGGAPARGGRHRGGEDQRARVRLHGHLEEPDLRRVAQSVGPRAHARRLERRILRGHRGGARDAGHGERRRRIGAAPPPHHR